MPSQFTQSILAGAVQSQTRANLASPWLKCILIVIPLVFGASQVYLRVAGRHPESGLAVALVSVLLGVVSAQSVDLRAHKRTRMIRWALTCTACEIVVLIIAMGWSSAEDVKQMLKSLSPIAFLGRFLTFSDILMLAFFVVAGRAVLLLSATDAFTLCGAFAWYPKLAALYEAAITSYFTIRHSVTRLFSQASMVSKNRFRLVRHQQTFLYSFKSAAQVYLKTLLTGFAEKAELTESVLHDHRWYSREAKRPSSGWNTEDTIALLILALFFGLGLLGWRIGGSGF